MLTKKQQQLLLFIRDRMARDGVAPSFDEMKEALKLRSKSGIHRLIMALEERGVDVFDDAVALVDAAIAAGVATAVVSASENAEEVLRRVGLLDRFAVRVTGREAAAWSLAGKPAPDTFLKAAELVGVAAVDAVVLEDAISGVAAGRAGAFGLVVGVDRGGAHDALLANGADVVVSDRRDLLGREGSAPCGR